MVTTDALKLLYKKLGGSADVDNITAISDMVDLIEDVAGEGGGGASGLVVTVSADTTTVPTTFTLDKNYTEISAAINSGISPVFVKEVNEEGFTGITKLMLMSTGEIENMFMVVLLEPYGITETFELLVRNITFMSDSATGVLTSVSE